MQRSAPPPASLPIIHPEAPPRERLGSPKAKPVREGPVPAAPNRPFSPRAIPPSGCGSIASPAQKSRQGKEKPHSQSPGTASPRRALQPDLSSSRQHETRSRERQHSRKHRVDCRKVG